MSAVPGEMETEVPTSICTQMFTAAPFTIAQQWEQPKCPPTERLIHKTWPLHPMDYDSSVKSDALAPATNPDELGRPHTEGRGPDTKIACCVIPRLGSVQKGPIHGDGR